MIINISTLCDFDPVKLIATAAFAKAIISGKHQLADKGVIILTDLEISNSLETPFNFSCHAVVMNDIETEELPHDTPHSHYQITVNISVNPVPCPDDISQN